MRASDRRSRRRGLVGFADDDQHRNLDLRQDRCRVWPITQRHQSMLNREWRDIVRHLVDLLRQVGPALGRARREELWHHLIGDRFASSAAVADHLLREAHIVVTDGAGFGAEGFLRFSYATSMENIQRAVSAMKELF